MLDIIIFILFLIIVIMVFKFANWDAKNVISEFTEKKVIKKSRRHRKKKT
jgi:hypothetical protein